MKLRIWIAHKGLALARATRDTKMLTLLIFALGAACFFLWKLDVTQNGSKPPNGLEIVWLPCLIALGANFFTLIVVYYLWHEGRDLLRGIEFMEGTHRNKEFLASFSEAPAVPFEPIRIMDTSIPMLIWGDFDTLQDPEEKSRLEAECERNFDNAILNAVKRGLRVQILLLHPNSIVARQRARDLEQPLLSYLEQMTKTLAHLHSLEERIQREFERSGERGKDARFTVRLYDKLPSITVYACKEHIYTSFFPHDQPSDRGTILKILRSTMLGAFVKRQFDSLLDDHATIDFADFMKLQVSAGDKGHEDTVYYLPKNTKSESLFSKLRPSHIVVSSENSLRLAERLVALSMNGKPIVLRRNMAGDNGESSEIKAFVEREIVNGRFGDLAKRLKERYGREFRDDDSCRIFELNGISTEVEDVGWAFRPHEEVETKLKYSAEFVQSWNNLMGDQYINDAVPTFPILRNRRIAKFYIGDLEADEMFWNKKDCGFHQCSANHLYLDKVREFAPMEEHIAMNPEFKLFMLRTLRQIVANSVDAKHPHWRIIAHQIRVMPRFPILPEFPTGGSPAPEGPHQDNHDYLSMHLIGKQNVIGGESLVLRFKDDKPEANRRFMTENLFDSIYLNDRRVFHDVTPLLPTNGAKQGDAYRDMLLIDYEKITTWHATIEPEQRKVMISI